MGQHHNWGNNLHPTLPTNRNLDPTENVAK